MGTWCVTLQREGTKTNKKGPNQPNKNITNSKSQQNPTQPLKGCLIILVDLMLFFELEGAIKSFFKLEGVKKLLQLLQAEVPALFQRCFPVVGPFGLCGVVWMHGLCRGRGCQPGLLAVCS